MRLRHLLLAVGTVALAFFCILLAGAEAIAAEPERSAGPQRWMKGMEVGKPAPDFTLPLLKSETSAKGVKVDRITDQQVKLSSFRGKKVVCLFMSSYT